jgi:quercetin dioxygenase-like cupin family protein
MTGPLLSADVTLEKIAENRTRYLTHTDNLMIVVINFDDGPCAQPDPPHAHPHEQVTYVAEGEVMFFLDGKPTHLKAGDLIAIPGNIPHCVQPLTAHLRMVDVFNPIREDFLKK